MDRFLLLNIILIISLIIIIVVLIKTTEGSIGLKVIVIYSIIFYIVNIIVYRLSSENDRLFRLDEINKFIFGPIVILLVYGLIRSGISEKNLSEVILFDSLVLGSMFILFYGYTIIIKNAIISVMEGGKRVYYTNQYSDGIDKRVLNNYVG
jgi:hypothetical protein